MTTTLDLPEQLYERALKVAAQRKLTLPGLLTFALQREVGHESMVRRRMEVPPVRAAGVPALTNAETASLFEAADTAKAL